MNPKLLAVIKREYLERVRSKAFWVSTILIPALGLVIVFINVAISGALVARGRLGIVDLTGRLYGALVAEQKAGVTRMKQETEADERSRPSRNQLEFVKEDATPATLADVRHRLNAEVKSGTLKAYIVLDQKTLESGKAEWRAESVKADLVARDEIAALLTRAVTMERLRDRGVDPAVYGAARLKVELEAHEAKDVEGESGKNEGFNIAASGILFFLIYMSIFIYGAFIMRGVLDEKNNRIIEVIISSVKPSDLMLGKIVGIGCVGLTQYLVWATLASLVTLPAVGTALGMEGGMPGLPLATLAAFVVFFLLGYFLYASMYAAIAAPFNTQEEAQQFVMLPMMILVLTFMTWFVAYNSPNGALAVTLSLFPLSSPLMMFMRISVQPPPAWQIGLSIALLLVSIWGMAWLAGRIYRVGILMYGKKPTIPEIFRWVRQAD